jgi:hypothetical protein
VAFVSHTTQVEGGDPNSFGGFGFNASTKFAGHMPKAGRAAFQEVIVSRAKSRLSSNSPRKELSPRET